MPTWPCCPNSPAALALAYTRVRARGSLIKSTNGLSNGIVPWLKTLDASVSAVNQGGKRKGAACVYLEPWHADVEEFLELRDNTGDEARRTHNLNLANWIPDIFMRRVESDAMWSLFDPKAVPHLVDRWGAAFDAAYEQAEAAGLAHKQVKARDLYARMMRTLAQTGNGWMTFKDKSNRACNQTAAKEGNVVHLSNLCTEIIEVSSLGETAVCNLGSINLGQHMNADGFDYGKLAETVRVAVRQLDRVIDLNFYPIESTRSSNLKWRPVGLGVMGLQDVFFKLRLPFDSEEARTLSTRIAEEIYYNALVTSHELALERGAHPAFADTRAAQGELQFDAWGVTPSDTAALERAAREHPHRRPAQLAADRHRADRDDRLDRRLLRMHRADGVQPVQARDAVGRLPPGQQVPRRRAQAARPVDRAEIRDRIKLAEGSVQEIKEIPERLRHIYRTAWEIPMRSLIDMMAARGAYIDQSASLNLFMESPNIGQLSSMYMYAWKAGLKTTYYMRSRPATKIQKTTVTAAATPAPAPVAPVVSQQQAEAAVFCSLENPEYCEACQ